jgi:hypothetical protein
MGEKTFNATAWTDEEDGIQSGKLSVGDHSLLFTGGTQAAELEFDDLELNIRGGKSPRVEISNSERSDWTLAVSASVLRLPPLRLLIVTRKPTGRLENQDPIEVSSRGKWRRPLHHLRGSVSIPDDLIQLGDLAPLVEAG